MGRKGLLRGCGGVVVGIDIKRHRHRVGLGDHHSGPRALDYIRLRYFRCGIMNIVFASLFLFFMEDMLVPTYLGTRSNSGIHRQIYWVYAEAWSARRNGVSHFGVIVPSQMPQWLHQTVKWSNGQMRISSAVEEQPVGIELSLNAFLRRQLFTYQGYLDHVPRVRTWTQSVILS